MLESAFFFCWKVRRTRQFRKVVYKSLVWNSTNSVLCITTLFVTESQIIGKEVCVWEFLPFRPSYVIPLFIILLCSGEDGAESIFRVGEELSVRSCVSSCSSVTSQVSWGSFPALQWEEREGLLLMPGTTMGWGGGSCGGKCGLLRGGWSRH